jgi:SAM-dependent methyltransferase
MRTFSTRVKNKIRSKFATKVSGRSLYVRYVAGKKGLEIGGPSQVFQAGDILDLYREVGELDNCNFARATVWGNYQDYFQFADGKAPGRMFFGEGSDLSQIPDASYDFVLSSHNLEHFANPVKAIREWQRVLRPDGAMILVLPNYKYTFDHRRTPTPVDHMLNDFDQDMGEDDLTHLEEILEHHDVDLDPGVASAEHFRKRSLANISNRCLHHHVFDRKNSRALFERLGFVVRSVDDVFPCHLCLLVTMGKS